MQENQLSWKILGLLLLSLALVLGLILSLWCGNMHREEMGGIPWRYLTFALLCALAAIFTVRGFIRQFKLAAFGTQPHS